MNSLGSIRLPYFQNWGVKSEMKYLIPGFGANQGRGIWHLFNKYFQRFLVSEGYVGSLTQSCLPLASLACSQPRPWLPLATLEEGCLLYFSSFSDSAMSHFLDNSSVIAHAFSVGAPSVLSSVLFLFTPQMVSSIWMSLAAFDMLVILKYIFPSLTSL